MFRSVLSAGLSLLLMHCRSGWSAGDQTAGEVKALIPNASRNAQPWQSRIRCSGTIYCKRMQKAGCGPVLPMAQF